MVLTPEIENVRQRVFFLTIYIILLHRKKVNIESSPLQRRGSISSFATGINTCTIRFSDVGCLSQGDFR
jgi:hypothetical protein